MFMDFLREHRGGLTHSELTEALQDLVESVCNERTAGTLTFTVTIKPFGKKDGLEVGADIKVKPPKQKPGTSIFYATPDNDLVRHDPRQQAMDLHEIPRDEGPTSIPSSAHKGIT